MKKLIPLLVILILLIPETKKIVDKYFLYGAEGMIAVHLSAVNDEEPSPIPEPDIPDKQYKCNTCKDTGIIKPDGVVEIPCPDCRVPKQTKCECLRPGCQCSVNRSENVQEGKKEVAQIVRKVKLFTQPYRCPPCKDWERQVKPKLIAAGFKVGKDDTDDIQEIDPITIVNGVQVTHPLWLKYSAKSGGSIPFFLAFEGDNLVDSKIGFINEQTTLEMLKK